MARHMTVGRLIELLEEYRETYGDDARVLMMEQETWPFEHSIAGVTVRDDFDTPEVMDDYGSFDIDYAGEQKSGGDIFLVEGKQLSYGSRNAWNTARK